MLHEHQEFILEGITEEHRQLFASPPGLVSSLLLAVFVRWGNSLSPCDPLRADR